MEQSVKMLLLSAQCRSRSDSHLSDTLSKGNEGSMYFTDINTCTKFELIPIKIGYYEVLKSYNSTQCGATNFAKKDWEDWEKILQFLLHFVMHIHVLMLYRKFDLILTKVFEL